MIGGRDFQISQGLTGRFVHTANPVPPSNPLSIQRLLTAASSLFRQHYSPGGRNPLNSIRNRWKAANTRSQGVWKPRNYNDVYRGRIRLREAPGILRQHHRHQGRERKAGAGKGVSYARKMRLTKPGSLPAPLTTLRLSSLALGGLVKGVTPLELTAAFTLANRGVYSEPIAILRVTR